jgi:hypothetical protein
METALVLTAALLVVPVLLLCRERIDARFRFLPLGLVAVAVLTRMIAFWSADSSDAQVVGYLPEGVSGAAALVHIFDGPAGLMLGLLLGFSVGLVRLEGKEAQRWAALCWVVLLGWSTPSDGFATIDSTPLSSLPSSLDWQSLAYPLIGLGLSALVIPTLVRIESASTLQIAASLSIGLLFLDIANDPVAWMLVGLTSHRLVALHISDLRGQATRRRWMGLMHTMFHSVVLLIIATAWLAVETDYHAALWTSRIAVFWVLLCGLVGSLAPTMGLDSRPRPEAWGFHTGTLVAFALLPGIGLIEFTMLPVMLLAVTMPVLATHSEFRPDLAWRRRGLESLILISLQVGVILYFSPLMLLGLIALPFLLKMKTSADEEE